MADDQHDYKVGPGRPPLHTRFRKGQSGNPGGRSKKKLHALLADALSEQVFVTIDGRTSQDPQARGGRPSAGQQIHHRRFAGDQDAVRHDQGRRAEGQRHLAGARTSPARCGGREGAAKFHRPDTTANPGRDRRGEQRGGRRGGNVIVDFVAASHNSSLRRKPQ